MSLGKQAETHLGRLPLLAELLTQIPHPLRHDLPGFLPMRGERTPSIAVLLAILMRKFRLEAAPMQVELHHISSGETPCGQGREEEFVDDPIACHADRAGRGL